MPFGHFQKWDEREMTKIAKMMKPSITSWSWSEFFEVLREDFNGTSKTSYVIPYLDTVVHFLSRTILKNIPRDVVR